MLSRVAGMRYGVAKAANTIVVKCPDTVSPDCFLVALITVLNYVKDPANSLTKTVLLMSIYWPNGQLFMSSNGADPNMVRILF